MKDQKAMRKPEDCTERAHIREEIDRVDRELIALFKQRDGYIRRMAHIKTDPNEARVDWRVKDVLDKVLAALEDHDLPPDLYMEFWEQLIDLNIDYETVAIAAIQADKQDTSGTD
ncbi:chorismate mutase [Cohaesibacter intestini]|uniref:chorismate mutase n=1 Tax=Cohaesibacter intestini TaxID=2211145 RepID=UPI001300324A|nr:chorismate mutase [Cohaesibacter intestini]